MEAYIQAKQSKDDQILMELAQWELNSWPKISLKLPGNQDSKDLLQLAKKAEELNINYTLLDREIQV